MGLASGPPRYRVARKALAAMQGLGSLGDDSQMTELEWRQQMLATSKAHLTFAQQQEARERFQKWVQIAVTAAIPVFGAIWRGIFGKRIRKTL